MPICCSCTVGQQGAAGCQSDSECEQQICADDIFCCGGNNGNGFWDAICYVFCQKYICKYRLIEM